MVERYLNLNLDDPRSEKIALALSNPTSKKILALLADKEMNATELAQNLNLPLNTIGYNLENLIEAGLIEKTKTTLWSVKGKKIQGYALADKKIIISPKKMFSGIIPALLASALLALGIKLFTSKTFSKGTIYAQENIGQFYPAQDAPLRLTSEYATQAASSAAPLAKETADQLVANADKIYAPLVVAGNEWLYFLLGALIAIIIILALNWKKV